MRLTEVIFICPICRTRIKSKEWSPPNCDTEGCNGRQMRKDTSGKDGVFVKVV